MLDGCGPRRTNDKKQWGMEPHTETGVMLALGHARAQERDGEEGIDTLCESFSSALS